MPRRPEVQEANITLRGHFTPTIFQPSWFASQDLLRKSEADDAQIQIIHRDAVVFSASWLVFFGKISLDSTIPTFMEVWPCFQRILGDLF